MSDQTPSLNNVARVDGSNVFGTPGGSGTLTSINGDGTPAQLLLAGTGITIVDGGGGAHTISLSAVTAITSINGDTTPAQVIAAGLGISVTDAGATHTIDVLSPNIVAVNDPGTVIPDSVFTSICNGALGFSPTPANFLFVGQVTFPGTPQSGSFALQLFDVTNAVLLAESSAALASNGTTNETIQVTHMVSFAASPVTVELRVFYQNSGGAGATCVAGGATRLIRKRIF
jgi:hypothetical protein